MTATDPAPRPAVRGDGDLDDVVTNSSSNVSLAQVVEGRFSRRDVVRAGGILAAAGFLGARAAMPAAAVTGTEMASAAGSGRVRPRSVLGFVAVPAGSADEVVLPKGYVAEVLIPWGTPLREGGPRWRKDASNTAAEQAVQVGMHHDGMSFFAASDQGDRGLLVLNHEYTDNTLLYEDGNTALTKAKVDKALAAHGVSIVAIARKGGGWIAVDSRYNRRVTGNTPVTFSGPVPAEHPQLSAKGSPRGTLNNCSNGKTPWGTYLTCEENWNNYFGTTDAGWKAGVEEARYGIVAESGGDGWHTVDPRFDVAANPREPHRFGWVVEIDPMEPGSRPVKRTALGRLKHEGATVAESDGRVVVYTGDDQDGEYVYKFVGDAPWKRLRAAGKNPLDHGTLYVARFADDGTGSWLALVHGSGPLTAAKGWKDQADVLLRTRTAADAVGATKLDRPEWIAVHPRTRDVYLTLTNGTAKAGAAVTPRHPNPYGHIVRWTEQGAKHTATSFTWDIFVLAGDPAYDSSVTLGADAAFGSPDGLAFDADGRLWICTDVSNSSQNLASKGYDHIGNNALLAADPDTGEIRRFLVGPRGAEITGVTPAPDGRTLFVNIQHPGEETTAWGAPTPDNPRVVSNWPDFDPAGRPRAATLAIRRKDGGVVGN
jgi:uncharacterized protein